MSSASRSDSYAKAGVDITKGYEAIELMKKHIATTFIKGVCSPIGGFGGLFELDVKKTPNPILVCGTDGVGTKLKLAFLLDKHDTVGIDCVAMCVNDVICCGAEPQVFLDYIALGSLVPTKVEQIVKGVSEGCRQAGCALIGGETAEMPGFYPIDEYDLAGFSVAVVDKSKVFDNTKVEKGDAIIALPSSGVHSNGFSLVRKVFGLEENPAVLNEFHPELGCTLGEALLEPTKIYVKDVLGLSEKVTIKAAAHITGGGFYENIPRCLPEGFGVKIKKSDVQILPIFRLISETGSIDERDMFNTFNMGVGMVLVVKKADADLALKSIEHSYLLGEVVRSEEKVDLV